MKDEGGRTGWPMAMKNDRPARLIQPALPPMPCQKPHPCLLTDRQIRVMLLLTPHSYHLAQAQTALHRKQMQIKSLRNRAPQSGAQFDYNDYRE